MPTRPHAKPRESAPARRTALPPSPACCELRDPAWPFTAINHFLSLPHIPGAIRRSFPRAHGSQQSPGLADKRCSVARIQTRTRLRLPQKSRAQHPNHFRTHVSSDRVFSLHQRARTGESRDSQWLLAVSWFPSLHIARRADIMRLPRAGRSHLIRGSKKVLSAD